MFRYFVCFFALTCCSYFVCANDIHSDLREEQDIYGKIFNAPLLISGNSKATSVSSLYGQKPLIVALVFTRCYGICNPFLLQLKENIGQIPSNSGFNILIVSFDPRDDLNDMANLAKQYRLENNNQWNFAVTDSINALIKSISFNPKWDSITKQFDHDALLVGINTNGLITKKLLGIRTANDIKMLISSIHNVFTPSYRLPTKSNIFSCFNYDPKTQTNRPGLGLLFVALPAIITFLIVIIIVVKSKRATL